MTLKKTKDKEKAILAIEASEGVALADALYFVKTYCYTLDQHDNERPIKRFPDKEYLWELANLWIENPLMLVAKTRQMMCSWLFCGLYLWLALRPGKLVFVQSKKEEDANALLDRIKFMYERIPRRLKWGVAEKANMEQDPPARETYCHLALGWLNSEIIAIPQGADILRSYTASGILSDEMAFQDEAQLAYEAAKPAIDGGGRFTGLTTPNGPGFFKDMLYGYQKVG